MNNIKERIKIFSGAQLKYIAFLSMLIDHTNKALIYPNLDGGALNDRASHSRYFSDELDAQFFC
jgi:hypothetical protein